MDNIAHLHRFQRANANEIWRMYNTSHSRNKEMNQIEKQLTQKGTHKSIFNKESLLQYLLELQ
jgi:hypothetical protein